MDERSPIFYSHHDLQTTTDSIADVVSPHQARLAAAFVSFLLSVSLWFLVDRELGLFVGLWVPAIHSLGTLVLTGERS